jgi:hypothetical protein
MADDSQQQDQQEDQGQNPGTDPNIDPNPEMESDAKGSDSAMPREEDANQM